MNYKAVVFANAFLRWVVNSKPGDDRQPEFNWMNLPESGYLFVFVGIVLAIGLFVFWTYSRELKTCPLGLRITLGFIRFTVLFLLALVFLKPSISFRKEIVRRPNIVLALDVSSSMDIKDQYRDPAVVKQLSGKFGFSEEELKSGKVSRTQLLEKAITRNDHEILQQLRLKGAVRVNEFELTNRTAATLNAVSRRNGEDKTENPEGPSSQSGTGSSAEPQSLKPNYQIDLKPTGRGTNVWLALKESLETTQLSTIVLVSDGQATTEDDPY
ncbi:MAG: hypothetical protein VX438_15895, partial [Planctomycetota bacterium]|nr:hypothetical protein [Planctomycetota bacterium]